MTSLSWHLFFEIYIWDGTIWFMMWCIYFMCYYYVWMHIYMDDCWCYGCISLFMLCDTRWSMVQCLCDVWYVMDAVQWMFHSLFQYLFITCYEMDILSFYISHKMMSLFYDMLWVCCMYANGLWMQGGCITILVDFHATMLVWKVEE